MKKIIWIVIIIILLVLGFYLYKGSSSPVTPGTSSSAPAQTSPSTKNTITSSTQIDPVLLGELNTATVSVAEDGSTETLENGVASFSSAGNKMTVALYSSSVANAISATKDVGGRKDVLAVVTVSGVGKNSQYLILFNDTGTSLVQKSITYLGNALDIQSLAATDLGSGSGEDYVAVVKSTTSSGQAATSIIPVKNGVFDNANSLSI